MTHQTTTIRGTCISIQDFSFLATKQGRRRRAHVHKSEINYQCKNHTCMQTINTKNINMICDNGMDAER